MKRAIVVIIAAFLVGVCAVTATAVTDHATAQVQQKRQKQRAQIIGQGKNPASATSSAHSNAAKLVGSFSFSIVSQNTTGKDKDWVCYLIIEYEVQ